MADLITIGVKVNADAAVEELMQKLKAVEKQNDGKKITYQITGDTTQIQKSLAELKNSKVGKIDFDIDDTLYQKTLSNLESITQAKGATIGEQFKNAIESGMVDIDVGSVLQSTIGTSSEAATNLKKAFVDIRKEVSAIDIPKLVEAGDYDELQHVVTLYEELASISKEMETTNTNSKRLSGPMTVDSLSKQFESYFSTDTLTAMTDNYKATAETEFEEIKKIFDDFSKSIKNEKAPTSEGSKKSKTANADEEDIEAEEEEMSQLESAAKSAKTAIENKTQAIVDEENQMRTSAQNEVDALNSIGEKADEVSEKISSIQTSATTITTTGTSTGGGSGGTTGGGTGGGSGGAEATQSLFGIDDLKNYEYFIQLSGDVTAAAEQIRQAFENAGFNNIKITGIEQLDGQIQKLTVSATDANNAIKTFNYSMVEASEGGEDVGKALVSDNNVRVSEANLEKIESAAQEAQDSITKLMNVDDRDLTSGFKSASDAIKELSDNGVKVKSEYTAIVDTFRTLSSINISSGMESSFAELESKVSEVNKAFASGEIDLKSYKNTCNSAVKDFNNISKALDQTATKLNTMSFDSDFSSQFDVLKTNIGDLNEQLTSGAISIDEYKTKVNDAVKEFTNMETTAKSVVESFNSINADTTVLSSDQFTQAQAAVDGLNEKLRTNQQVTQEDVQAVQQAVDAYKQLADAGTIIATDLSFENAAKSAEDYASTLGTVVKTNNQLSNEGVSTMAIQVRTATGEVQNLQFTYNAAMNTMSAQTVSLNKTLGNTTNLLDTFKTKLTNLSMYWTASLLNPMKLINVVKQGVSSITEMDTALTEMRRVSDETVTSLQNFQDISFELGNSIGVAAIDIQNSAADFMRLGYSLEDATEFAKDANIYANVGLMDIDTATEHMVSSIKAWGDQFDSEIEASSAIIDRYNEIGRNIA